MYNLYSGRALWQHVQPFFNQLWKGKQGSDSMLDERYNGQRQIIDVRFPCFSLNERKVDFDVRECTRILHIYHTNPTSKSTHNNQTKKEKN